MFETGLIYRNPQPHLYSRLASFPSRELLPDGDLLAAFGVGSGFERVDQHTVQARSRDGGRSWQFVGPLFSEPTPHPTSSHVRISRMPNGELPAFGAHWNRSREDCVSVIRWFRLPATPPS
jgi:hypothetical protein